MKHLERLKKMATWGVQNEWIEKAPFDNYKLKYKRVERESLNEDELFKIENRIFDEPMLKKVQQLFIFSCYAGLSYVDVMQLKPENVAMGTDGFQ